MNYMEIIGVLTGAISVYLAAVKNILTWPIGLINVTCLFLLFYNTQLYPDMVLQLFFLAASLYGWIKWGEKEQPISSLSGIQFNLLVIIWLLSSWSLGYVFAHIHTLLPNLFPLQASYPYVDSKILVASIIGTILLIKRKWEAWVFWILVDFMAILIYFIKGLYFLSFEYFIFLLLAIYGYKKWKHETSISIG